MSTAAQQAFPGVQIENANYLLALVQTPAPTTWTRGYCGTGVDGAVHYTVNSSLSADLHATDIIIDDGVTLDAANFKVFFTGTLTGGATAKITNNGAAAVADAFGVAAAIGTLGAAGSGGAGNVAAGSAAGAVAVGIGGTGGAGGAGGGGAQAGGAAGVVTAPIGTVAALVYNPPQLLTWIGLTASTGVPALLLGGSGGGGGGGDAGAAKGGGGGAGAGNLLVSGNIWSFAGALEAKGGAGAAGTAANCGGGGGGGGGRVVWVYRTKTVSPTVTVTGGDLGASGGGTGAVGVVGGNGGSAEITFA